jgi:hypothetical protein
VNAREVRCANNSGIIYEFGNHEFGLRVIPARRQMLAVRIANRTEKQLPGNGNSATEYEEFGVKHSTQTRTRLAQPVPEFLKRVHGSWITGRDEISHDCTVEFAVLASRIGECETDSSNVGDAIRHSQQCPAGAVLFNTTAGTASAREAVGNDTQMPELSASTESASEEIAARDDRPAYSGADGEHRHVANRASGAEPVFRPSGRVRVVVDRDVEIEALEQVLAKWLIAPADVGRVVHRRLLHIDETGRRDPGGHDLATARQALDHLDDRVDYRDGVSGLGGHSLLGKNLAGLRDDRTGDLGSPDVYTNGVHDPRAYR